MLRDNSEDTLSFYMEAANRKREIPVSSCPTQFEHHLYSGQQAKHEQAERVLFDDLLHRLDEYGPPINRQDKPKPKRHALQETRSYRISVIRDQHPGGSFYFCRVDTENVFAFEDVLYMIHPSIQGYQPKETKHGLLYDMDQVVIVRDAAGRLHHYTQQLDAIAPELIKTR